MNNKLQLQMCIYSYLSTHSSIRVHLFKSGNVNLATQVAQRQGPTEPKHSQRSAF